MARRVGHGGLQRRVRREAITGVLGQGPREDRLERRVAAGRPVVERQRHRHVRFDRQALVVRGRPDLEERRDADRQAGPRQGHVLGVAPGVRAAAHRLADDRHGRPGLELGREQRGRRERVAAGDQEQPPRAIHRRPLEHLHDRVEGPDLATVVVADVDHDPLDVRSCSLCGELGDERGLQELDPVVLDEQRPRRRAGSTTAARPSATGTGPRDRPAGRGRTPRPSRCSRPSGSGRPTRSAWPRPDRPARDRPGRPPSTSPRPRSTSGMSRKRGVRSRTVASLSRGTSGSSAATTASAGCPSMESIRAPTRSSYGASAAMTWMPSGKSHDAERQAVDRIPARRAPRVEAGVRVAAVGADEGDGADDPDQQLVVRRGSRHGPEGRRRRARSRPGACHGRDRGGARSSPAGAHRDRLATRPPDRGRTMADPPGPTPGSVAVPVEPEAGPLGRGVAGAQPSSPTINARTASRRIAIYYDTVANAVVEGTSPAVA